MGCGSSSNPANAIQQQQQQQQNQTNQAVSSINSAFSGFNPSFYQGVQTSYNNWALPQLQNQYQQANSQLGYKLAGQGLLNSSAATQAQNALSGAMTANQNQIGNQAVQQANSLKQTVGQEQSQLIGQAQTATNPSSLAQSAIATAANTTAPSTFAPLGSMFSNFGNQYLASQTNNTYNSLLSQYLNGFSNPAIFGTNSSSVSQLPTNQY